MPKNVNVNGIEASQENCILELKIPKREIDRKTAKKIEVK